VQGLLWLKHRAFAIFGVSTWNELHPTIRNKVLATLIPSLIEDFLISSGQWR